MLRLEILLEEILLVLTLCWESKLSSSSSSQSDSISLTSLLVSAELSLSLRLGLGWVRETAGAGAPSCSVKMSRIELLGPQLSESLRPWKEMMISQGRVTETERVTWTGLVQLV